jgi:pyruvate kinase
MKKIKIICTIGPSSFKRSILNKLKRLGVDIFRINLSHTKIEELIKNINLLKSCVDKKKICIDTEGAQVRTGHNIKTKILKKNQKVIFGNNHSYRYNFYPKIDFKKLKLKTKVFIGFDDLILKILKINKNELFCKVLSAGKIEPNKGVHFNFNELTMPALTEKDIEAIKISKKLGVRKFALSFANSKADVQILKKLINKNDFLISKIETSNGLKNLKEITKISDAILLDRGDLSRYVPIHEIPLQQMKVLKCSNLNLKPTYIATNLLETMINKQTPTRAEANDIYQSLFHGARGLVLAAETAIGKYPIECVQFIKNCIKVYSKNEKI